MEKIYGENRRDPHRALKREEFLEACLCRPPQGRKVTALFL